MISLRTILAALASGSAHHIHICMPRTAVAYLVLKKTDLTFAFHLAPALVGSMLKPFSLNWILLVFLSMPR